MTTQQYCLELLDDVEQAGHDPELAYMVRTRLRRALVALERGRSDSAEGGMLDQAPPDLQRLADDLAARVLWLCQPSEALDVRWKREWKGVLDDVATLRAWTSAQTKSP